MNGVTLWIDRKAKHTLISWRRFLNNQSGGPFINALLQWEAGFEASHITLCCCRRFVSSGSTWWRSWSSVRSIFRQLVDWLIAVSESLELDGDSHHIGASESWLPFRSYAWKQSADRSTHALCWSSASDHLMCFRCPWECACSINTWENRRNSCSIYNMLDVLAACRWWLPFLWKGNHGICN